MDLLGTFNRGNASDGGIGDGLLMRDGYTMVFVGWEFDVPAPRLRIEAPAAILPAGSSADSLSVEIMVNERAAEAFLIDDPAGRPPAIYPPAESSNPKDVLIVRDHFLETGTLIPRARWRFVAGPNGLPKIQLDGGFDPVGFIGSRITPALQSSPVSASPPSVMQPPRFVTVRICRFTAKRRTRSASPKPDVSFVNSCTTASTWTNATGVSSTPCGCTKPVRREVRSTSDLRRRRRAISSGPTRFPFSDSDQIDIDGTRAGLSSRYRADQLPKIFYVNTSVEYWGGGRAAALTHTTVDGKRDLVLPDNIRIYFLAGTQHIVPAFPPVRTPPVSGAEVRGWRAKWWAAVEQSDASRQRHARAPPRVAPVGGRRHTTTGQPVPTTQRQDLGLDST